MVAYCLRRAIGWRNFMPAFPVIAMLAVLAPSTVHAGTIEVHKHKDVSLVVVRGPMVHEDINAFRTKTSGIQNAVVALQSDGGSLLAGIEIGKMIRFKNYFTLVPAGSRCASACAVAWLGGTHRYLDGDGKIGFHAAYIVQRGRPSESGAGNAVLGSYLGQLGLPETAIVYITQAAPKSMTWLDVKEAQQRGIQVATLAGKSRPAGNAPTRTASAAPESAPEQTSGQKTKEQTAARDTLTPQQTKMKECGAKWQAHKKEKNVKGQEEYRKFLSTCLKG